MGCCSLSSPAPGPSAWASNHGCCADGAWRILPLPRAEPHHSKPPASLDTRKHENHADHYPTRILLRCALAFQFPLPVQGCTVGYSRALATRSLCLVKQGFHKVYLQGKPNTGMFHDSVFVASCELCVCTVHKNVRVCSPLHGGPNIKQFGVGELDRPPIPPR